MAVKPRKRAANPTKGTQKVMPVKHGPGESKTSVRRLAAHERHIQALEMRKAGKSYRAIAAELGYDSPNGAYYAVLSVLQEQVKEPAAEVVKLELDRLDQLYETALPMAVGIKDEKGRIVIPPDLDAMRRCLQIMDRRAKFLGLDVAARQEAIEDEVQRLANLLGLNPDEIKRTAEEVVRGR